MPPLFLLGPPAAGKTRVGRLLARRLTAPFIDLDTRIERLFATPIPTLFTHGEPYFRACERTALRTLLAEPGFAGTSAVVATGGGIVCDPSNLEAMAAVGPLVYLELPPERLAARLTSDPDQLAARPVLAATEDLLTQLTTLVSAREHAYRQASLIIDADATPEEVADRVLRALASR